MTEKSYQDDPQVLEVVNKVSSLVTSAQDLKITDDLTDGQAKAALSVVTVQKREFEKLRKSFVSPLNDHVKTINAFFKQQAEPLIEAEGVLKRKVGKYFSDKQAAANKEQARLDKLAERREERAETKAEQTGQPVTPQVPAARVAAPIKTTKTDAGSVTMRTVRKYEIINEDELPRECMMPNDKRIKALVDAKIDVPGVRVYEEQVPVVRRS